MLTKEQVEKLRARASVAVEDCEHDAKAYDEMNPGFALPGEIQRQVRDEWKLIGEVLAAYGLVAACLETWETTKCDYTQSVDAVRESMIAELRRALEG
jgi:hypothetical protein